MKKVNKKMNEEIILEEMVKESMKNICRYFKEDYKIIGKYINNNRNN